MREVKVLHTMKVADAIANGHRSGECPDCGRPVIFVADSKHGRTMHTRHKPGDGYSCPLSRLSSSLALEAEFERIGMPTLLAWLERLKAAEAIVD